MVVGRDTAVDAGGVGGPGGGPDCTIGRPERHHLREAPGEAVIFLVLREFYENPRRTQFQNWFVREFC